MMNRRKFIQHALVAGAALSPSFLLTGCSGWKRTDVSETGTGMNPLPFLEETSATICRYASLAPSGHNSQPWRVRVEQPDRWVIEADPNRKLPAVDPENRELILSLGAFVENLSIAAGAMGLATDIDVVARQRHQRDIMRLTLRKDRKTNVPLEKIQYRRTVKHGLVTRELSKADVDALSAGADDSLFYFPRGTRHAECIREAAVENYRIQSRRQEAQRELVRWLRLSHRDAVAHRDGLSTAGMEISGLAGWMVRNFSKPEDFLTDRYRKQGEKVISELAGQGGGWMVMTSPGETVADLVETGRRFERMALIARERGIGIHPMTQILEERHGLEQLAANHGKPLFPQFVLRVGYLNRYPKPVSLRRPVSWFAYRAD